MGKHHFIFIGSMLGILLWSLPVWAAASISARLDRDEMQVGEQAFLTISITYDSGRVQTPNIMENPHLSYSYMGTSTSVSIVNMRRTDSIEYRYLVEADAPGDYTIEGISSVVDKQVVRADPLRIKVLGQGQAGKSQQAVHGGISLEATISNNEVYVGQQVIYKLKFIRKNPLADANYEQPELGDFLTEKIGDQKDYESVIGGVRYAITEIKMALFPTKPGHFTIDPAVISGSMIVRGQNRGGLFDDFFMNQTAKPFSVKSNPVEIDVKPLPSAGRPAGFSGLVGQYQLGYDLSKKTVRVNESTTLTLVVEGYGNVPNLAIPAPGNNNDFKIYEDKPHLDKESRSDGIFGRYIAKWALVPSAPGTYPIPELRLSYFDPETEEYKTLETGHQTIEVLPGNNTEDIKVTGLGGTTVTPTTTKQQVAVLGEDVMAASNGDYIDNTPLNRRDNLWFWPIFLLPPATWLVMTIRRRRQNRSPEQLAKIRANKAYAQLVNDINDAQNQASYEKMATAVRSYYAAKLQQSGCAITPQEVAVILKASGAGAALCDTAAQQLAQLEKALYLEQDAAAIGQLAADILATMKEVDHAFHNK